MIEPLEFQREYLRSNPYSDTDFGLETMIDASLKYRSYDNVTSCTLYRPGLSGADIKTLAKYVEAGYNVEVKYIGDEDYSIQLLVYYVY